MNIEWFCGNKIPKQCISTIITILSCLAILLSFGVPLRTTVAAVHPAAPLNYQPEG